METEIKLAPVLPHQAAQVLGDAKIAPFLSAPRKIRMHSDYFDTDSGALRALGFALRLRRENERSVCTLKGPAPGPDTRLELEAEADNLADGISTLLARGDIPAAADDILRAGGLAKICSISFVRTAYTYKNGGLELELCHDEGQTEKAMSLGSVCELELELKAGGYPELCAVADYICQRHGLARSSVSKLAQAMSLGGGHSGRAVNPFFVGAEMLNYCIRCKYIELTMGEDKQLRYVLTELGGRELPRLFGVSFDKPCAFTGAGEEQ